MFTQIFNPIYSSVNSEAQAVGLIMVSLSIIIIAVVTLAGNYMQEYRGRGMKIGLSTFIFAILIKHNQTIANWVWSLG